MLFLRYSEFEFLCEGYNYTPWEGGYVYPVMFMPHHSKSTKFLVKSVYQYILVVRLDISYYGRCI